MAITVFQTGIQYKTAQYVVTITQPKKSAAF